MSAFDPSFYSTVAQVLPVFLLVIVAQLRLGQREPVRLPPGPAIYVATLLVTVLAAEVICLEAVADRREPSAAQRAAVYTALTITGCFPAVIWFADLFEGRLLPGRRWMVIAQRVGLLIVLALAMAMFADIVSPSAVAGWLVSISVPVLVVAILLAKKHDAPSSSSK